ncbi:hypothetical protein MPSEU_000006800 [Mayamaea pseudoterrestris]|nr:hypothetical protein MPSEU_000006800 [Mayamaea pseudoterrestris]
MPSGLSSSLRHAASLRANAINISDMEQHHRQYNQQQQQQQSHILNDSSFYDESLASSGASANLFVHATASSSSIGPAAAIHTMQTPHAAAANTTNTTAAAQARREWQTHGTGLSSALEDKRLQGTCVVRIVGAADRLDASHTRYTAYLVQVQMKNDDGSRGNAAASVYSTVSTPTMGNRQTNNCWTVERRYSDFDKLHQLLEQHQIKLYSAIESNNDNDTVITFPGKHWAGRMGNWTPSLTWAPNKHDSLVQYRTTQLDIWLVYVLEWYNYYNSNNTSQQQQQQQQQQQLQQVAKAIWQFLTEPFRPPCQQIITSSNHVTSSSTTDWKWHNPFSFSLTSSIRQATHTLLNMTMTTTTSHHLQHEQPFNHNTRAASTARPSVYESVDRSIPLDLLHAARGLVFMTVLKAGLMVSGRVGTGLVIARLDDPTNAAATATTSSSTSGSSSSSNNARPVWSAPCALGTVGMGWGALIGGDVTHYLVVLTTSKAVQDLVSSSSMQLGAELGVAVGPLGRGATGQVATGDWTLHPAYAYAHSQGLFAGISLEGSIVTVRNDVNAKFYACPCDAKELLRQRGPKAAEPLYEALENAMNVPIPEGAFRPTQFFSPEKGPSNPCATPFAARDYSNPQHPPHYQQGGGGSVPISYSPVNGLSSSNNGAGTNYAYSEASSSQYRSR